MNTSGKLRIRLVGIDLEHPVMNASGILGSEPEHVEILASAGFSAIVTKTFTLKPSTGYPMPIMVELENGGFLNAVGLANPGIDSVHLVVEKAHRLGKPVVVSIGAKSEEEFAELAIKAESAGVDAIELNLSCPHVRGHGLEIGCNPELVYRVVKEVSSTTRVPILAKLGLCDKVVESAGKALEAGARGLTLINTIRAIAIDVYSFKPVLSNKYGGFSGPPIKPIAVRVVYDVYREYQAEIIGCGGITNWKDAAEFIVAGAKAVQIGSAFLRNRNIVREVLQGLEEWLKAVGYSRIEDLVGAAQKA
ncbi:MAG: dihydroorotate dehydrogenase PyrD [Desulfurococcaceae archaeon]